MLAATRLSLEEPLRGAPASSSSHLEQSARGPADPAPNPPLADVSRQRPRSTTADELGETRSTRSSSTASRCTNRLSLTLPIAPPTAPPSRPVPTPSSSIPSYPPTPLDTPSLTSPVDPSDFIPAIAAQERRVLELREELTRAESELTRLKKQWAAHESYRKRHEGRTSDPSRRVAAAAAAAAAAVVQSDPQDDDTPSRRSIDFDRRKALLMGQQSQPSTPGQSRRRVFTGSHARTLSLLSPTKPDAFSVHEDVAATTAAPAERARMPLSELDSPYVNRYAPIVPAQLPKRASWAPRSAHSHLQQSAGVKQIAQDFKAGLWTFMEDLRQATVGEEPVTGQGAPLRGIDPNGRFVPLHKTAENHREALVQAQAESGGDQDTIRASGVTPRPLAASVFEKTPTPASRHADLSRRDKEDKNGDGSDLVPAVPAPTKPAATAAKRFSWTPLTVNSYDDSDWSNWDSPTVDSPRWSGTTANGDIIPAIPEKDDENRSRNRNRQTPSPDRGTRRRTSSGSPSPEPSPSPSPLQSPNKLEELIPPVLNRLTPGNLKRTASDFMREWEKSLSPPPETTTLARDGTKCRVD